MGNKTDGLLALLGVGALAWWKYKKSSTKDKKKVKDTINTAKDNLTKFGNDLKDKASQTAEQLKDKANDTAEQFKNKAEEVKTDVQNAAQ